jgi:hypothetical protein
MPTVWPWIDPYSSFSILISSVADLLLLFAAASLLSYQLQTPPGSHLKSYLISRLFHVEQFASDPELTRFGFTHKKKLFHVEQFASQSTEGSCVPAMFHVEHSQFPPRIS